MIRYVLISAAVFWSFSCIEQAQPTVLLDADTVAATTLPADCKKFMPPWGDEYWEDWGKAHGEEFEKWYMATMPAMKNITVADIEKCAHLDNFFVGFSKLDTLAPFAKMPHLRKLDLRFSAAIKDLTPLSNLTDLEELTIWGTDVTDLTPVKDLPKLRRLDAKMTKVSDLRPVAEMKNLVALDVLQAPVADIMPLAGHPAIAEVVLCSTKVTDITPPYDYAERVTYLDLRNTPITSLKPLEKLEKLETLIVAETKVSKKEITRFKKVWPAVNVVKLVE